MDARTSGGFFERDELAQAGLDGRHNGKLAGFFIEGGGDGEDDILICEGKLFDFIPCFAEGGDVARGNFDGGEDATGAGVGVGGCKAREALEMGNFV
jgi:hypothetical protein